MHLKCDLCSSECYSGYKEKQPNPIIMKHLLTASLIFGMSAAFAQSSKISYFENYLNNKLEKLTKAKQTERGEHAFGQKTFVTEALKYRIDSLGEEMRFSSMGPYEPLAVYGYSFSGFGNHLRVTEERMYEYNSSTSNYDGMQMRRRLEYNNDHQLTAEIIEVKNGAQWVEEDRTEITYKDGRTETVKLFYNNQFMGGDSLSYTYNSNNLVESVSMYSDFGMGWELNMKINDITYQNGLEESLVLEIDQGFGLQPFFRFTDLEWDFGYYPVLNDILSFMVPNYSAELFMDNPMELPSQATIQINLVAWMDMQKIVTTSNNGTNAELLLMVAPSPFDPLDTNKVNLTFDAQGRVIYALNSEPSSSGVGYTPAYRDSVHYDTYDNIFRYVSAEYDESSSTYYDVYYENRDISYAAGGMPTEIELEYNDGFFEEYYRYTIFGGEVASTVSFVQSPFNLYPNPASTHITLKGERKGDVQYEIYDLQGRALNSGEWKSTNEHRIDINQLASGQYIIRMNDGKSAYQQRFVVR
jgi:hypothetical protein